MTPRSSPDRRRSFAPVWLFAIGLMLLSLPSAVAGPGSASDADDVPLRLDLKTASHTNAGSSITYTVETYEEFPDNLAAFKWAIDKNGDQRFDVIVFAEWESNELVAGIDDVNEEPVAEATVSRPAANAIQVSFSANVLGNLSSYEYRTSAEDDRNGNGETDAGEEDVAPDSGLYRHELASAGSAVGSPDASPAAPVSGVPASSEPAPHTSVSAPGSSAAPPPSQGSPVGTERAGTGGGRWVLLAGVAVIAGVLVVVAKSFTPRGRNSPNGS
jgi:hypothetical protein